MASFFALAKRAVLTRRRLSWMLAVLALTGTGAWWWLDHRAQAIPAARSDTLSCPLPVEQAQAPATGRGRAGKGAQQRPAFNHEVRNRQQAEQHVVARVAQLRANLDDRVRANQRG